MNTPQFRLLKPFQIRSEHKQFSLEASISQKLGWENLTFGHFFLNTLFFSE